MKAEMFIEFIVCVFMKILPFLILLFLRPFKKTNLILFPFRFLQFAVDWGRVTVAQSEVRTLNERALASGGALHRPQNKKHDLEVK